MQFKVESSSSKEVWNGVKPSIHILDPCVVNRVVDSQNVEYLKRYEAVFIEMFLRCKKFFGKTDVNPPVRGRSEDILIPIHRGWTIGEACAKKQTQ